MKIPQPTKYYDGGQGSLQKQELICKYEIESLLPCRFLSFKVQYLDIFQSLILEQDGKFQRLMSKRIDMSSRSLESYILKLNILFRGV